jgi:4-alpha-glucanotransferase
MQTHSAAILLPLTSLPDNAPIGVIGKEAYRFIDRLSEAGISYWQMLPVHFFDGHGCPYASPSAFGGNPLLLNHEDIDLLLKPQTAVEFSKIDFQSLYETKLPQLIQWASTQVKDLEDQVESLLEKLKEDYFWVHDLCIFLVLRDQLGYEWTKWPKEFQDFSKAEEFILNKHKDDYQAQMYLQFEFHRQWKELKNYAHNKGVKLIGDIPIFVSAHSFDCWRWKTIFKVDQQTGIPHFITGAPPDDFSADGQLWGTVNYAWNNHEVQNDLFNWWIKRLEYSLELFDLIRIDHFIGIYHVWESEFGHKTAANGKWVKGNGAAFLQAVKNHFPQMPFIAEDLGALSQEVIELRDQFHLPTMKVFQFSISDNPHNEHLPSQVVEHSCYYSGTHDNNTLMGWLHEQQAQNQHFPKLFKERLDIDLDMLDEKEVRYEMIKKIAHSKASMVIFPLQDIFGFDGDSRINVPGTVDGNWQWRLRPTDWSESDWQTFLETLKETHRLRERAGK